MGTGDNRYGFYAEKWERPQGGGSLGLVLGLTALFPVSVFQGSEKERDLLPAGEQEHQDWIPVLLTHGPVLSLRQRAAS